MGKEYFEKGEFDTDDLFTACIRIANNCQTTSWCSGNLGVPKELGTDIMLTLKDGKIIKADVLG